MRSPSSVNVCLGVETIFYVQLYQLVIYEIETRIKSANIKQCKKKEISLPIA